MKRFARALVVVLGLAVLGAVVSLVPQKNATATGSAPVTITNTATNAVPVTGSVSITNPAIPVSGNLGVTGNVPVVNPMDANGNNIPLLIRDADNGARQPFMVEDTCTFDATIQSCGTTDFFPGLSIGQTFVVEDISGECTVPGPTLTQMVVFVIPPSDVANRAGTVFFTPVAYPSSGGPTVFGFGRTVKAYATRFGLFDMPLEFEAHGASQGNCNVTYSGYLINP